MFHFEVVVFIAVFCAVNAAVTVNIYEPDTVKTKVKGVERCDQAACSSLCRILGYKKGTCVGDTCECTRLQRDGEQFEQNNIPSLDEDETGKGLRGCNPSACDQLCRRLQFPGGTCINGRCKCDNFRPEPDQLEQNDIPSLDENAVCEGLRDCDFNACDQLCRRLKFPGGACVNGRCKCDNFRLQQVLESTLDPDMSEDTSVYNSANPNVDIIVTNAVKKCDQLACMMGCREIGFPGGSCFMDKCQCNKGGHEEEIIKSLRACNSVTCSSMCRRLKYAGGWCRFGRCECYI